MAIPSHVADHIEAIKVGDSNFALNAELINGHSWSDITALVETGFSIVVYTTLPSVPTSSQADKDNFYNQHKAELALVADAQATAGTYVEYVLVKSGESPNFDYAWESIGTTQTDLSNYAQKATITLTGDTGFAGAQTITSSSDGAQTASGSASITYSKATGIGEDGAHTHGISAHTIDISFANTDTTGTTGTLTPITDTAGAHTHSVTTAAHSHEVNLATEEVTFVTGLSGGNVAGHSHSYEKAILDGQQTFITQVTGTFLNSATVSSAGVLSWSTGSISTTAGTVGITYTSSNTDVDGSHTISVVTATFANVVGATLNTAAPTGETSTDGDHVHAVPNVVSHNHTLSTETQTIVQGITITQEAGAHTHTITLTDDATIGTVVVAVSSHNHTINVSNHSHSVSVSGNNYN